MGWTKEQIIKQALLDIGLGDYVFNLKAEEMDSSLKALDSMMAVWNSKGIRLGYPLPSSPNDSLLSTDTNVPDASIEAIYKNLSLKISPSFGKAVSADQRIEAKKAYDYLLSWVVFNNTKTMSYPETMPIGSGNKDYGSSQRFYPAPSDNIETGSGSDIDL